jgi:hypothetical protein
MLLLSKDKFKGVVLSTAFGILCLSHSVSIARSLDFQSFENTADRPVVAPNKLDKANEYKRFAQNCGPGNEFYPPTMQCRPIAVGPSPTDTKGCPPGTVPHGSNPVRCVVADPPGPPITPTTPGLPGPCMWNGKGDPPPCWFPPCPTGYTGTPGHCTQIVPAQKLRPCPSGTIGSYVPNCRPIALRGSPKSIEQRRKRERVEKKEGAR